MAIEEIQETQDPVTELINSFKKSNTRTEERSPREVVDDYVEDASSAPETSSTRSSAAFEKMNSEKGGLAAVAAAFNPMNYGHPVKDFIHHVKRKSGNISNSTISMLSGYDLSAKSIRQKLARIWSTDVDFDCTLISKRWRNFTYSELVAATNDFSPDRLVGKGGNAEVYKGCLPDGTLIAVKKLTKKGDNKEERTIAFLSELGIIAHVDHPNAAKLVGFGVEHGLYLVLQFSPLGSVDCHLQGAAEPLDWKTRFRIALGVAEGLSYLHHDCKRRIIHRDIKSSNILLAEDYEPLISDFGLAKWLPDNWLHHVVYPIEGTLGYLAPEYFMHGIADEKTDVYAYGVLLLEIITGRQAVEVDSSSGLVMWAKPLLGTNNMKELVDPRLGDNYDPMEMSLVMAAASICVRHLPERRPYMNQVVDILRGDAGLPETTKQAPISPRPITLNMDDYTSTKYSQDLTRHRQLVLE